MSIIKQTEVHTVKTGQTTSKQVMFHNVWSTNAVGSFAAELIKHAMMSGAPQNPEVMVDRCVEIADLTFKKFEQKGWLVPIPSWDELNEPPMTPGFGTGSPTAGDR